METTKEFLAKLSKINFTEVEPLNEFRAKKFSVKFHDKVTPEGATVTIYLKHKNRTIYVWGAWGDEAIEAATWREKLRNRINKDKDQQEAIGLALAKKIFIDL